MADDEQRKTRISPIRAGDMIVAQPIREDLQDEYEELLDALDKARVAQSNIEFAMAGGASEPPKDLLKAWYQSQWAHQKMCIDFWAKVREIYDEWTSDLRLRDGYTLVKLPPQNRPFVMRLG